MIEPYRTFDDSLSMTIKTACKATQFSRDKIYELLREGQLKSFTMGHRRFIITQSIREYLERRAAEPLNIRHGRNRRTAKLNRPPNSSAEPQPIPQPIPRRPSVGD